MPLTVFEHSISTIVFPQDHPVAAHVFFVEFPSLLSSIALYGTVRFLKLQKSSARFHKLFYLITDVIYLFSSLARSAQSRKNIETYLYASTLLFRINNAKTVALIMS
jgi:hypothetical protein